MLPKSHFRPLSRPRENGFVERSQNFVAASSMKSVHGLAKTRACEERYMADPSRSAGNLDPCRQGRQAELPAFGPRGCKRGGGGGNSRLCCRADCSRRRRQKPEGLSKAARIRLRSTQENRRRQGHDGACDTLLIRRSSEFIKIFGTSSLKQAAGALAPRRSGSGPRQNTFKRMRDKNPGADQTHHRCEHLEHCEHPLRPRACATKRRASPHSQKDFERRPHNRRQLGIWRNRCAKTGRLRLRAWRKSND